MRRLLKFLHTMGAVGLLGATAALLILSGLSPPPSALAGYAATRGAMGALATWLFLPGLAVTVMAGLLAIALNDAFHNAGWAWVKFATGILVVEGFVHVQGTMQDEAARSARALAGQGEIAGLGQSLGGERLTLGLLLAVATANVALGIWRPRFGRRRTAETPVGDKPGTRS